MLPMVSILIPTYNRPYYFQLALQSAMNQTYPHIEIVICDNSDNDQTEQIVRAYQAGPNGSKIRYVRNEHNIGSLANQHKVFALAEGEYINYLNDDDTFHPAKIKMMMEYMLNQPQITLVTSRKERIDPDGFRSSVSDKLFSKAKVIDGIRFGNMVLTSKKNLVGEPTTVLFRKTDLTEPFGSFCGKQAENNVDTATWLSLLAKGNAVYLPVVLSSWRLHPNQLSKRVESSKRNLGDWIDHVLAARTKGFLQQEADFVQAVQKVKRHILNKVPRWMPTNADPYMEQLIMKIQNLQQEIASYKRNKSLREMAKELRSLLEKLEKP